MAEKRFKPGDFVRLSPEGRAARVTEMDTWEGTVEDVREFTCCNKDGHSEHFKWVVVDWGIRQPEKKSFVWLEKPEHLSIT